MACRLCVKLLPVAKVEELDADLKSGNETLQKIADSFDVEVDYVTDHYQKCLGSPASSGYELLARILEEVTETTKEMRESYDPTDDAGKYAMGHYIKLVRELRETVATMDKMKPSGQLLKQITDMVMNPLISQFAKICIEEVDRHRSELTSMLGDSHRDQISKTSEETLRRLVDRYKKATDSLIPQLKEIIQDDRAKARSGRSPKDPSSSS